MAKKPGKPAHVDVTNLTHDDTRKNIPSAEHEAVLPDAQKQPVTQNYAESTSSRWRQPT